MDEVARLGLLAGTMGSQSRVYHVGLVVADLDEATATLGPALGVTFLPPNDMPFRTLHTPEGPREIALRLTYSTRPLHVELIEAAPGTLWDFDDDRRGHHLGIWTDDVAAEAGRLDALGMDRLWWALADDGTMMFSYHDTPYGFYLELVSSAYREGLGQLFRTVDPGAVGDPS